MTSLSTKPLFTLESKSSWKASRTALANHSVSITQKVTAGFQTWVPWKFHLVQPSVYWVQVCLWSVFMKCVYEAAPEGSPAWCHVISQLRIFLGYFWVETALPSFTHTHSPSAQLFPEQSCSWLKPKFLEVMPKPAATHLSLWPSLWCLHICCCM